MAEEIRRLASQVSEASRAATDELAGRAIENVEAGSELIGSASSNMEGSRYLYRRYQDGDIPPSLTPPSSSSKRCLDTGESMDSLSQVVQENSAASEESAVIGEELAERANELKHLIGRFQNRCRSARKRSWGMTRFRTETGSAPSGSEGIREDRERLRADNAAPEAAAGRHAGARIPRPA